MATKHLGILTSIIKDHTQDQPFTVKNPKLDSNSALAKKRRAKGGPLPQLQVILTTIMTTNKQQQKDNLCHSDYNVGDRIISNEELFTAPF